MTPMCRMGFSGDMLMYLEVKLATVNNVALMSFLTVIVSTCIMSVTA